MNPVSRYSTQQVTAEDEALVLEALRSDWLTQGPMVERFEEALAEYVGAKYAVAVCNGTAALELAYRAAKAKKVLTSPLTFMATANAALMAGAEVIFQDVNRQTGLLPAAAGIVDETDADVVAPVWYAGRSDDDGALESLVRPAIVIEDACHVLGAMDDSLPTPKRVGSCAHSLATVFSFHPVKPITTGEGGAITTNDEGLARALRSLRDHGRENGLMVRLGTNARMTEIQAALGLSQLKRCDEMRNRRCALAHEYCGRIEWAFSDEEAYARSACCDHNVERHPCRHAHHLFTARIGGGRRDEVKAKLNAQGIGAQVHYSPPIHLQPYYMRRFGYKPGDFPEAEAWANEELSLPLHAGMSDGDVGRVCAALREALG